MIKRKNFLKIYHYSRYDASVFLQHQQNLLQTDDLRHLIPLRHGQIEIVCMVRTISHVDLQTDGLIGQPGMLFSFAQMSQ